MLSVVLVTWNSGEVLEACLSSLAAATVHELDVVVVDNASGDDTLDVARRVLPAARVITNTRNRGLAAGNNQGLLASRGEVVIISNPDVEYLPGSLDELLAGLERHPRAAITVARLQGLTGELQTSAGSLPTLGDAVVGRALLRKLGRGQDGGTWWDGWSHDEERRIDHGQEACYAVRREALVEIGGQDERYWLDWEGLDWAARVAEAGWEIWFVPAARVVHLGGVSVRRATRRWVVASHKGMWTYFGDRHPRLRLPLLLVFGLRALLKLAAVTARPDRHWNAPQTVVTPASSPPQSSAASSETHAAPTVVQS